MTTNVPTVSISATGPIIPAESAVLQGVQLDMQNAFGGLLNNSLETPQGQLASTEAAAISQAYAIFALVLAQMDPATSDGVYQDAIGSLYGLTRVAGSPTVVNCVCNGAPNTVIPVGALVQDTAGNTYSCTQVGTIPSGGSITLQFQNTVNGAIPALAGTLTKIYRAISGWDTVSNPTDGTLGNDTESRADFEARRTASLAVNSRSIASAIQGAVLACPGVTDCYVVANATGSTASIGSSSYSLAARTIYIGVTGGVQADIAAAIWSKIPPGRPMAGNTTVPVDDPNYTGTPPSTNITYNVPTSTNVYVVVRVVNSTLLPANASTLIKNAVIAAFAGNDGGPQARMGNKIFATRFAAPIMAAVPTAQLLSIYIGLSASPTGDNVLMGIDQAPITDAAHITVTLV